MTNFGLMNKSSYPSSPASNLGQDRPVLFSNGAKNTFLDDSRRRTNVGHNSQEGNHTIVLLVELVRIGKLAEADRSAVTTDKRDG